MEETLNTPEQTVTDVQVANTDTTQTQVDSQLEENNTSDLTTITEPTDSNIEEVTENVEEQIDTQDVTDSTSKVDVEHLQSKLKEYELRDEESMRIRERLGIREIDPQLAQYQTIEAQINNQSQRAWIDLCNKYGVDSTPNGIDKSCQELEAKDPKSYYQFKAEVDRFSNDLNYRKSAIAEQKKNYEIGNFYNSNKNLIESSPVVKQMITRYIQENFNNMSNPSVELGGLMEAIKTILLEGVEVGKAYSQVEKAKRDKSKVNANSSIATANTQTTSLNSNTKWTRERIESMSTKEFEKYEKEIERAMIEGQIE